MMLEEYDLAGKTALVTGGGKGLGAEIALALAQAGANVAVAGRNVVNLRTVAHAIEREGRKALAVEVDIRSESSVQAMVDSTVAQFDAIDVLVNNAGIFGRIATPQLSLARWNEELATNLTGPFLCMKAVQPVFVARGGGSIVNIASVAGLVGRANLAAYCASKAGLVNLTRALAIEWAPMNIRINAIAPGQFDTDMGAPLMANPDALREFLKTVPLGRVGNAREVGVLAVMLASGASAFMTGQVIALDGGATAH